MGDWLNKLRDKHQMHDYVATKNDDGDLSLLI